MTTIAFIGLGMMGLPMAKNLVDAGFTVRGFNRTPAKAEDLAAAGGQAGHDRRGGRRGRRHRHHGPRLARRRSRAGRDPRRREAGSHVDRLLDHPARRRQGARRAGEEAGLRPLDAPVSGGEPGAVDGVLSIMVGGDEADFAAASEVFEAVGKTIVHVGPSGAGQTVKAANQLIVAGNIGLLAEAVVFLEAYGVDTASALEVLGGGLAGSKVLEQKGQKMLDREFAPGFRLALHHKDMGIVTAAAREAGVTIPLGAAVAQLVAATVAQGNGGLDHSGLLTVVEQLSGTTASAEDEDADAQEGAA